MVSKIRKKSAERFIELFLRNPSIETARIAFISCYKNNVAMPKELYEFINNVFEKEHQNMLEDAHFKKTGISPKFTREEAKNALTKNQRDKELLLWCALNSKSLEMCYALYKECLHKELSDEEKKYININGLKNSALRMRLDRYLDEVIEKFIKTQLYPKYKDLIPKTLEMIPETPKRLSEKLEYFQWLIKDD